MRGGDARSGELFSYVDLERRMPAGHPLRKIREVVNAGLAGIGSDLEAAYARIGRPSIAPEKLLRALLLQFFHGIRSERQMMERLDFDLSFRWFVGLGVDDRVWDASTFSKNRERLLDGEIAARFLSSILALPQIRRLLSSDHFSVDGTLIEAWCSMKSFRPKEDAGDEGPSGDGPGGRNAEVDFRGTKRSNDTHASLTDPDARLYRKSAGTGARLCYMGHVLMENRHGLVVDTEATRAAGFAERLTAVAMVDDLARPEGQRITLGADRAYDTREFVSDLRDRCVTPHVAQNTSGRRSAIDGRTTRHAGYAASQRIRKRIEEVFGWVKSAAGQGKTRFRGLARVRFAFTLSVAAYNLIRLPRLLETGS
ncbi:IS5 family transposase ISNisp7 (plasmid) [Sphingomonas paucimobilis]|uniref:IS5 family transposase n=1 Tax=Sphingomonas TaxID=13687 RepID=UPI0024348D46|nr:MULTISPECIES: IS5 family transposase [Sphingomonas]MDG5973025.1 IS5 family transposase ISNisp7 [Sphingomonas paucimobilis]MDR6114739.1 transposase [Sphingomonas sp. SORGH_AS_0789]MDR6116788.1 transposase [Sphingomonas sp. SORGH_AS_0789]MDR6151588.1 transposase [Sphingomonas sp. SORGH_AS_0742]MDR6151874.1 transposase [Sphingomonas sp. SORGH_AS_0742]